MIEPTRLVLCLLAAAACRGSGARGEGAIGVAATAIAMPDTQPKTALAIPPIDAAAPAAFQTATFALG